MAMLQLQELDWHQGEHEMHDLMHNPHLDNPTVPTLSPQLANHLRIAPLIAIGVLDANDRPWTTLWGTEQALGGAVAQGMIGIRAPMTPKYDPVVEQLFGDAANKEVIRPGGGGRMVSGVTIDLETRKRVKLFGHLVAGAIDNAIDEVTDASESIVEAQLILRIEQSLGNCPKYLNQKHIVRAPAVPKLLSDSPTLPREAVDLVDKADLFFISSSQNDQDMDTNHRGGPPGFMRIVQNSKAGATLCWPEYSGNRFYQTLGNLKVNPIAGICVPDFENGDMLYMTGTTEILIGRAAGNLLPRSNLAVKFTATAARMVAQALPFRGLPGQRSPYNPTVRYLAAEKKQIQVQDHVSHAMLKKQTKITPTISRYLFALDQPVRHRAGQYVTLDFGSLLDGGYSHMRDDDPTSLNDDFVRTFTVSSSSDTYVDNGLKENEFEITIRHIGEVTQYMSKFEGSERARQSPLEVEVKGFGGDFEVVQRNEQDRILFLGAGIGITPLLSALHMLDLGRVSLLWSIRAADLALVVDVFQQFPMLAKSTSVFVTHQQPETAVEVDDLRNSGAQIFDRRLGGQDLAALQEKRIFVCAATPFRKQVSDWLPDREILFEDFNF